MHEHVWVTADRRSEVCIVFECKAVVTEIFSVITGLGHCPEREEFYGVVFRRILGCREQIVKLLGYLLAVCRRSHAVAEVAYEVAQVLDLLLVRLVMHTIDKCLGLLARALCRSVSDALAAGRHKLRHSAIGQEHELLDEPVGLLGHLLIDIHRTALLVHLDLHLRTVEAYGSSRESLLAELGRQTMKRKDCRYYLCRDTLVSSLRLVYDLLSFLVCKSIVGIYDGLAEPLADDAAERSHLEDCRECEFLLLRTEGAEFVAELLREHRHGPVHQVYRCAALLRFFVHNRPRLHIVSDIGDMDSYLVVAVFQQLERQGVVKVLCVSRVYGECQCLAEVPATFEVLCSDLL